MEAEVTDLSQLNKRTKIVATIGPVSRSEEMIEKLARAGMNCARLNMSHGSHEEHAEVIQRVRQISDKLSKPLAVLVDLQGPKIRLGILPEAGLEFKAGELVQMAYGDNYEPGKPVPVQYDLSKYVQPGQPISMRDGMVQATIKDVRDGIIEIEVHNDGAVFSKQGINLPDTDLGGDILTDKDIRDIEFAASQDVDYVALSFVQTAKDIENLRNRLKELGSDAQIIAKIETKAAIDNIESIVDVTDAVMVARGDLAVEVGAERVPVIQRKLVFLGQRRQRPVIVATQMLESMINSPQPTRAEVSDVATAVTQGADAVMLSAESATGKYPVETVALMKRVILYNEHNRMFNITRTEDAGQSSQAAISLAVITLAKQTGAKLILAETSSGRTARVISSFRPDSLILGVTDKRRTYNQLAIVWGTRSYLIKDPHTADVEVISLLKAEHNIHAGDVIVNTSGTQAGVTGMTDTIQVETIT
ncbi:MAG: pyruvate kinase [Candidatus Saccharimonadales bacterium]